VQNQFNKIDLFAFDWKASKNFNHLSVVAEGVNAAFFWPKVVCVFQFSKYQQTTDLQRLGIFLFLIHTTLSRFQEPTPAPFVDDLRPSAEFYANRILKDFKGQ
jgi:hypothetical protein